ncbi:MAG: nucleotidyltransferase domain-containing protein [Candidatus Omnitrophota bacterium]
MFLFKSIITKALLNYFFINPEEELYINEIVVKLSLDKRNLVKKLKELELLGVIKSRKHGNLKLYSINKKYALYNEVKQVVIKTFGFKDALIRIAKKIQGIEAVYIYGSYAKNNMDTNSDIDILVIGNFSIFEFQKQINALQKKFGREINMVSMDLAEFTDRKNKKDEFISTVLKEKHILVK